MTLNRLIGPAPDQVSVNGMLGNLAFQNAESVNLGSVSVEQLLGQVPSALGTAAAPTYTFTGDVNTGIYSPGTDQVAISTGGIQRATVDSSGRLLVGTSSDAGGALLQVNGDRIRVGTAKTPASATATGTAGEICWDANYIYVCTAANTWKRTAIATW